MPGFDPQIDQFSDLFIVCNLSSREIIASWERIRAEKWGQQTRSLRSDYSEHTDKVLQRQAFTGSRFKYEGWINMGHFLDGEQGRANAHKNGDAQDPNRADRGNQNRDALGGKRPRP